VVFKSSSSTPTKVRFVEKQTGHLYEISLDNNEKTRVLNKTILRTLDSAWSPDGNFVVMSFLEPRDDGKDFLRYYYQTISTSSAPVGDFISNNVTSVAGSPAENKMFYLQKDFVAGKTIGNTATFDNKSIKTIFSSLFGEFNTSWVNKDTVGLLTKPSGAVPGQYYALGAKDGKLSKIVGNINGLTAIASPDLSGVVYSESSRSGITTRVKNILTGDVKDLDQTTFADKCVWSKKEKDIIYCGVPIYIESYLYPDAWYQGVTSFNDAIWKIDLANNISQKLMDTQLDVINPALDADETTFIFQNKKDLMIWSLGLPAKI
jgi:Tol biopolymer transport system component